MNSTSENEVIDCLKELLNVGYELNASDSEGDTTLIFASSEGNVDYVKELIVAGADVNIGSDEKVYLCRLQFAGKVLSTEGWRRCECN